MVCCGEPPEDGTRLDTVVTVTASQAGRLKRYRLGRKRLLDTMLAATLKSSGVKRIVTNNERDFKELDGLELVAFRERD